VPELQRLRAGHAPAVLAFELANRAYFAASVSDRGDEFYDQFTERHNALLAEQEAGTGAFYVLVAEDGSVLGRFNLYRLQDGTAELGYRVAERVAGRGEATAAVRELCRLAVSRHGLRELRAATSNANVASQKVLAKAGFVPGWPSRPGRPRRQGGHLVSAQPSPWLTRSRRRPQASGQCRRLRSGGHPSQDQQHQSRCALVLIKVGADLSPDFYHGLGI
jgi:[ribosomal protein S5]-alanine N-acetyltransferase